MSKWVECSPEDFELIFKYYDHDFTSKDGNTDYYKNTNGNVGKITEVSRVTKYYILKGGC